MVKVTFYNLLRSKYKINETIVEAGTIHFIVDQIVQKHPVFSKSDFESCVVFFRGKAIHLRQFEMEIPNNAEIIITHFVGGG